MVSIIIRNKSNIKGYSKFDILRMKINLKYYQWRKRRHERKYGVNMNINDFEFHTIDLLPQPGFENAVLTKCDE